MKISLITENWPPQIGGIQNYLENTADQLHQNNHDITVVIPKNSTTKNQPQKPYQTIRKKFFRRFIRPRWWLFYRWAKKQAAKENWQVTLCGKALFEGMIGYLLKKRLGIPYVIFTYAMEIEEWNNSWRQKMKLKKVFNHADKIVCINETTKQTIINLGVKENKIVKAWPGVNRKMLKPAGPKEIKQVLDKYQITQPYILSVGRLIERKGFDLLIDAYSDIDQTKYGDVQLVIAGDGPMLAPLQAQVEGELIDNSVIFLPDVTDQDLRSLYAGAALFALTPKQTDRDIEGFGIVYLEAAAQGTPAIGTNIGGVSEAVIDGGTGIVVQPDDKDAIRKATEKILSNTEFKNKLGQKGKERVNQHFTWEERITTIQKALDEIKTQV